MEEFIAAADQVIPAKQIEIQPDGTLILRANGQEMPLAGSFQNGKKLIAEAMGITEDLLERFRKLGLRDLEIEDLIKKYSSSRTPDEIYTLLTKCELANAPTLAQDLRGNIKFGEALFQNVGWVKAWESFLDEGYEALRKNPDALKALDDAVTEGLDGMDAIQDAIQTLNKNKWEEIKALFKRGNDFNRKAITDGWYDYNEIHLANGKRLDSYDPDIGEIVSRKATDFDNIQSSTFENYLKEIENKYAPGTIIRSNKYPDIDGQALQGSKILEVPAVNQNSSNRATFEALASQYNTTIRYKPE